MKTQLLSLALIASLAACSGGNPFEEADADQTDTAGGETDGDGITADGIPPGTESPTQSSTIFRSEEEDNDQNSSNFGNGFAKAISYNSTDDTFSVDNLAFDGDSPYTRGTLVSSLNNGAFNVYEGEDSATDPINDGADGVEIPTTQFAIVRTGSYIPYGFGGFIYQRDTSVSLPETLQASFSGTSAGIRDFIGTGGLQYTTADVRVVIDSDDFNDGAGVRGEIFNRRVLDLAGNDVTTQVAGDIADGLSTIPVARFSVGPGVLFESGDLIGEITSQFTNEDGESASYETGNYYAVVSGDDPDEIVGIFVLENSSEQLQGASTTRT